MKHVMFIRPYPAVKGSANHSLLHNCLHCPLLCFRSFQLLPRSRTVKFFSRTSCCPYSLAHPARSPLSKILTQSWSSQKAPDVRLRREPFLRQSLFGTSGLGSLPTVFICSSVLAVFGCWIRRYISSFFFFLHYLFAFNNPQILLTIWLFSQK